MNSNDVPKSHLVSLKLPRKWNEAGEIYLQQEDYREAISCFEKSIEHYAENDMLFQAAEISHKYAKLVDTIEAHKKTHITMTH